jgi:perosamine synthetase
MNASERNDETVKGLLSGKGRNIPLFKVFMPESVMEPLRQVLFSGFIGEGPRAEEFERLLAPWFGTPNVLTLNNGTAALHLALRLAGAGPGTEVISTPMTCSATNEPILANGAKIVWADIDPWTGNIDPESVARRITPRTKAIVGVHWGGYPCELDELNALAARHGVKLIEDACHAFGAAYRGRPIGSHSDFACFSFQAIKHLTTVDGGALTCRSPTDCERGRLLRWYGINRKAKAKDLRCEADIPEYGYKFHMNDVTAALGIEQLKYVGDTLAQHRRHAARYDEAFAGLTSVRPLKYAADRLSSYWLYTIRVKDRAAFMEHMEKAGVTVSQVHARNDRHTAFQDARCPLPGVDEFTAQQLSIPVGWWLTEDDLATIINAVLAYEQQSHPRIVATARPARGQKPSEARSKER